MDNNVLAALQAADEQYSGVEAAEGFALHPEFKGVAEVTEAKLETKKDGTVQLFVRFKTEHGSPAIWQPLTNFKSDAQVGFTKKVLLHLGHTGKFLDLAAEGGTAHLIGAQVEIQVKHETYEGTKRERVYTNRAVEGDMDSGDMSGFAAQFNATTVPDAIV